VEAVYISIVRIHVCYTLLLNSVFYSCWMSVKEGTIFAFVVPALVIILVMKYKQNQTKVCRYCYWTT